MKKIIFLSFLVSGFNFSKAQWNTTNSPHIYYNSGNVGIGTANPVFNLQVSGSTEIGDGHDPIRYGMLQLTRPADQGDDNYHLSFIRSGNIVSGIGYARNSNLFGIWVGKNGAATTPTLSFTPDNVGIGTASPQHRLDVFDGNPPPNIGDVATLARFSGMSTGPNLMQLKMLIRRHTANGGWTSISSRLQATTDVTDQGYIEFNPKDDPYGLAIGTADNVELMRFKQNGNVGIGTTDPGSYKLAVEGTIGARKVKVTTGSWADYVFEHDYKLLPLQELERFINKNKHLPEVPSAKEVEKDGLDVGDNQVTLLKKIEELTLYVIAQNKKIEAQQKQIEVLQSENKLINELKNEIDRIKASVKSK